MKAVSWTRSLRVVVTAAFLVAASTSEGGAQNRQDGESGLNGQAGPGAPAPAVAPLRLVVQITVDQLRADLLDRYATRFGEGGFRRLLTDGVSYTQAYYSHANTETIVGHATLATGAPPRVHGMVGNLWYDRDAGRVVYNIEDARYNRIGDVARQTTSIFGPEEVARSSGRSPLAIIGSTFSDELAKATQGRARIYSVALKDRAAVPMAGRSGKALWYAKASGRFVSSSYYFDSPPVWLVQFNKAGPANRYAGTTWDLLAPRTSYRFGRADDRAFESMMGLFGRVFPHAYGEKHDPLLPARVASSPAGDELLGELAKTIVESEQLGQRDVVDYLAVGFSATDYVGHTFGPDSLEAEDNLLRLDRTLARLLASIDAQVGAERVLIVLSADHGISEAPEARRASGFDAGRLSADALQSSSLRARVAQRFDSVDLIVGFTHPYVHLDRERIADAGLALHDVQRFVANELALVAGVERAVAAADLGESSILSEPLRQVAANHHAKRSGDVYVVPRPHWLPYTGLGMRPLTATHGSPWRFDRHVPIIFARAGLKAARVARPVDATDVAPTLSAYVGVSAPSHATGSVLGEIVHMR